MRSNAQNFFLFEEETIVEILHFASKCKNFVRSVLFQNFNCDWCIGPVVSELSINEITLDTTPGMTLSNCQLQCGTLTATNLLTNSRFDFTQSIVNFNYLVAATPINWSINLNNSWFNSRFSGPVAITNPFTPTDVIIGLVPLNTSFLNLNNNSYAQIDNGYNGTNIAFVASFGVNNNSFIRVYLSSLQLNNCTFDSFDQQLISAGSPFIEISANNITVTNHLNTLNTNLMDINQGTITLSNINISANQLSNLNFNNSNVIINTLSSNNSAVNYNNCPMVDINTININNITPAGIIVNNSTLVANNGNLINTNVFCSQCPIININNFNIDVSNIFNTGLELSMTRFSINSCVIFNATADGILVVQESSGKLSNVSGSNGQFGVNLLSGSSFRNDSSNSITGFVNDVNVGALGRRSWAAINAGLATDTNDYTQSNPQYVYISP